jgi:hypothetical protein
LDGEHSLLCKGTEIGCENGIPILTIDGEHSRALASFLRYWFNPSGYISPAEFPCDSDPTSHPLVRGVGVAYDYWRTR